MTQDLSGKPGPSVAAAVVLGVLAALGAATIAVGGQEIPWVVVVGAAVLAGLAIASGVQGFRRHRRSRSEAALDRLKRVRSDLEHGGPRLTPEELSRLQASLAPFREGSHGVSVNARRLDDSFNELDEKRIETLGVVARSRVEQELDTLIGLIEAGRSAGTYSLPR